jgi:hypothetical protein
VAVPTRVDLAEPYIELSYVDTVREGPVVSAGCEDRGMPRIPPAFFRAILLRRVAVEVGVEEAREKAISELRAGAIPPFSDEILLTAFLVREMIREELPYPDKDGGRIYVLAFEGPVPYVKIGSTEKYEDRFDTHELTARNHCYSLVDGWVSQPVDTPQDAKRREKRLIERLHHELHGFHNSRPSEYFHQADFHEIVAFVVRHGIAGMRRPPACR